MGDWDRLKKYVSDYVEGQLDPSTQRQYEEELKINPELRELTTKVSTVTKLLKNLPFHRCGEDFNLRLRERIHNDPQKKWLGTSVRRYSFAFSFIVILAVAIFALNNQSEDNTTTKFSPSKNAVSSDNNAYENESIDVKTRSQQPALVDSNTIRMKEKKDPRIKYVDQKK